MKTNYMYNSITALSFFIAVFASISRMDAASISSKTNGDWSVPATWNGDVVPGSSDDVTISPGNMVRLTDNRSCLSLSIEGSSDATLNIDTYILNTGNINLKGGKGNKYAILAFTTGTINTTGNFNATDKYTFTCGTGTMNFNGTTAQTTIGVTYNIVKINNINGVRLTNAAIIPTLTIGDVTANSVLSDGGFQITSTGTLNLISGTFNLGSATATTTWPGFATNTISNGTTVAYISGLAGGQTISTTPTYKNLTFSGAAPKNITTGTALNIGTDWNISGGLTTLNGTANATVTGNLFCTSAITMGSGILTIKAFPSNIGTFTPGTGTVILTSNNTLPTSITSLYNLIINGGTTNLPNSTIICNSIKINQNFLGSSVLSFNLNSYVNVNGAVTIGGTGNNGYIGQITMSSGGSLECSNIVLGNATGPYLTSGTGTILLNANNTLPLAIFYNLSIKNGTTTLSKDISVFGDLNIGLTSTAVGILDVSTSNYTINLYGDFNDNNTTNNGFVAKNGNVVFKGKTGGYGKTDQYANNRNSFYDIEINKPFGNVFYTSTNFTTLNDVSITSGTLLLLVATNFRVGGNLAITGTLELPSTLEFSILTYLLFPPVSGTLTLNANSLLKINGGTSGINPPFPYSDTVNMDRTSTVNYCNSGDQYVCGLYLTYGNLIFTGSGTKTMHYNTNVKGDINVYSGVIFDATTNRINITLNGATTQNLKDVTFYDATINNTASSNSIQLNSNTTITNNITFTDGIVNALSFPLLFQVGAATVGAKDTSHVMGIVKKATNAGASFTFPVGNGIYYRPIGISNSSADTWTASYDRTAYSNTTSLKTETPQINHVSIIEYWNLSPINTGTSMANVMLSWNPVSFVKSTTSLVIAHWNGTAWENVGTTYTTTPIIANGTITANNTWSSFSPFTLGSTENDNSLPIELLEFKANVRER